VPEVSEAWRPSGPEVLVERRAAPRGALGPRHHPRHLGAALAHRGDETLEVGASGQILNSTGAPDALARRHRRDALGLITASGAAQLKSQRPEVTPPRGHVARDDPGSTRGDLEGTDR